MAFFDKRALLQKTLTWNANIFETQIYMRLKRDLFINNIYHIGSWTWNIELKLLCEKRNLDLLKENSESEDLLKEQHELKECPVGQWKSRDGRRTTQEQGWVRGWTSQLDMWDFGNICGVSKKTTVLLCPRCWINWKLFDASRR